ncbi:MAG: alpha/beta hydrolase [Terracidiphilus sp.]
MLSRLVLLPGMHGTGELFSDFTRMIPEQKHAQALHYPTDISLSYSQLLGLVQSFVPESDTYVLLAESFSAPLAIQFAAANPPNLKGLILCAGFATSPIRGWRKSLASLIAPFAFRLPLPKIAVSHLLVGPDAPDSLNEAVRAAIRSVNPTVLMSRLQQVLAVDTRLALSKVSVPILFLQPQQDRLVGPTCLKEIVAIKPQIEVVQIQSPHLILQREPEQSAQIVTKFIDSLPQS